MKTQKLYVIFGNYGGSWEVVDWFENRDKAKRCLGEYRMSGDYFALQSRMVREDRDVRNCRYRHY